MGRHGESGNRGNGETESHGDSLSEPLLSCEAGAAKNSLQQVHPNLPSMGVGQRHYYVTPHHVWMLPAFIGSLETQSTESPHQLIPGYGDESRQGTARAAE